MWENRSETLKEYTYNISGFGRARVRTCALRHPSFFAHCHAYRSFAFPEPELGPPRAYIFQAAPYGAKLHLTELRLTFLSSAES